MGIVVMMTKPPAEVMRSALRIHEEARAGNRRKKTNTMSILF
jgi:hypothetical protein